jgi:branched-chain amino acid transport system substrate-binding protein
MKLARSVAVVSCFLWACALFSFSLCVTGEAVAETKTIKIGLISSVTGPMAPAFKSELLAAKPAADLLNQKGGITVKGQKYHIEIVTADDQSSPPGAVSAANKLLQEGIKFVISPMFVPNDMAIAPICEEAKVLRVCPNRTDPAPFGPPNRYSFDAEATLYDIPVAYDKLKTLYPQVKRIAIIKPDDPGVKIANEVMEKEIKKRGMEVVFNESYKIPTEDFYPILTKVLATKPDAIECIFAILPWARGIINQSRELGFTGPITAVSAGFGDTNMLKEMLDPKNAYDICHAMPDVWSPKMLPIVKEFGKLVEKETKEKLNLDHVLTLQALWVIAQGIEKAQSFDTDKVASTLETMKSIDTPYGKGRFGGKELIGINRLMIRDIAFSRITKGGKVEYELLPFK